jgi:hypothetical protein
MRTALHVHPLTHLHTYTDTLTRLRTYKLTHFTRLYIYTLHIYALTYTHLHTHKPAITHTNTLVRLHGHTHTHLDTLTH